MPELPEVEILVRHLGPVLQGRRIRGVDVRRARVIRPDTPRQFVAALVGAKFLGVRRRAKFLVFQLAKGRREFQLVGHLGMTGRMYLQPAKVALPKHAAVTFDFGRHRFVYEDPRYFGRLSTASAGLDRLGPEPLDDAFTAARLGVALARSRQPIKVKLLDQSALAGVGNIYASEALFLAGISPRRAARSLKSDDLRRLWRSLRRVLREAIQFGSTVPLNWAAGATGDGLFYYGGVPGAADYYEERLRVYDRAGQPCPNCQAPIRRIVQAGRSTFFCPRCQRG